MDTILSYIDRSKKTIIELERLLTAIPALGPESGGDGELEKCIAFEAWLRSQGLTALERHDAPDARVKSGIRPNLLLTIPGARSDKCFWVMTHLDVVPPGELSKWNADPWTLVEKDGRLYGRGVEDNQQGLTSSVIAVLALLASGKTPPYTVKLLFVADEEIGSTYGIHWLIKNRNLFNKDDMILIPDGGNAKGELVEIAEKSVLWLRIHTKGVQCHASRPSQGINAHIAAAELAVRLYDELPLAFSQRDTLFDPDCSTFQPTKSEPNVPNVNTIPGDDVFYLDMRVLPSYASGDILKKIESIMREVEKKRKVTISYEVLQRMESKPTSADAPIVKQVIKAIKSVYGVDAYPVGIGGGTVAAHLRNEGIDSVVWSKLSESAHQANEYVLIDDIIGDAKVMATLMMGKV